MAQLLYLSSDLVRLPRQAVDSRPVQGDRRSHQGDASGRSSRPMAREMVIDLGASPLVRCAGREEHEL